MQAIPRYGRNVTTHAVLAGRIPVTRVTPALPDGRWRPKAFEGEVVPFRATVFREGHDQVGAHKLLGECIAERARIVGHRTDPIGDGASRAHGCGEHVAVAVVDRVVVQMGSRFAQLAAGGQDDHPRPRACPDA